MHCNGTLDKADPDQDLQKKADPIPTSLYELKTHLWQI